MSAIPFNGHTFTFVHISFKDTDDVNRFLGPFEPGEEDTIVWFTEADWADLSVQAGMFPSKGQARKNSWGEPLQSGLQNRQQKKGQFVKKDIWVLNSFPTV